MRWGHGIPPPPIVPVPGRGGNQPEVGLIHEGCPGATGAPRRSPTILSEVFERFTDRARRVLVLAQEEARLLNHPFIGTEHILLGLIHEGEGIGARALESLGISLVGVRQKVEETIGTAGSPPIGSPPFTPRAKKVLELSLREAIQLNQSYIGTEHLLLGLAREGEGVAAAVLVSLGAELDRVRQVVIELMWRDQGPHHSGPIDETKVAQRWPVSGPEWAPPAWVRPSEGTVPAVFAVDAIVLRNDAAAVAIDRLEVYPNGFTINLLMRVDPRKVPGSDGGTPVGCKSTRPGSLR